MPADPVRDAAIDVLLRVFEQRKPLDAALDKTLRRKKLSDRGRRFLTQLVYGTVRHREFCDAALRPIYKGKLDEVDPPIRAILQMGVFQSIFCDQVTPPAMVHTSVDLAKKRGHAGTARLVNAVLRKAPQTVEDVRLPDKAADLTAWLSFRYSLPAWIVDTWRTDYGDEQAEGLCAAMATEAQPTLRVNTLKTNIDELGHHLTAARYSVRPHERVPGALVVSAGGPPLRTKWFQRGHFMLQDPASLLPGLLMEPQSGERVLDLCAAPGGKSTHMAELAGGAARIVAADREPRRIVSILENLERLESPNVHPIVADGAHPPFAGAFDAVLVDAPCSGLGTLRRHPDLKWRATPESIDRLAEQQRALLRSAIGLCKNGGRIVYAVCTLTHRETLGVVEDVLNDGTVDTEDGPDTLTSWQIANGKYRTNPASEALDGFFLTHFRKRS